MRFCVSGCLVVSVHFVGASGSGVIIGDDDSVACAVEEEGIVACATGEASDVVALGAVRAATESVVAGLALEVAAASFADHIIVAVAAVDVNFAWVINVRVFNALAACSVENFYSDLLAEGGEIA